MKPQGVESIGSRVEPEAGGRRPGLWQRVRSAFRSTPHSALRAPHSSSSAAARRIMDAMPPEFWRSTVPPTLFRIRALRAEPVPEGYAGAPGDLVFKASKKQRAHRMTHGNTSGAVRMMATIQPNPRRVRPWSSCHRPGMTKFTIGGTLLINWNISLGAFDVKREVYP